jgi:hypothetical protein
MNKKGVMTILITVSVFLITILFLSNTNYNNERIDYSQQIINSRIKATNFEIILNQSIQDCNWAEDDTRILGCINDKSEELLGMVFETGQGLNCTIEDFVFLGSADDRNFIGELSCQKTIRLEKSVFEMTFSKNIRLNKYK